jgi:hypothetical protein
MITGYRLRDEYGSEEEIQAATFAEAREKAEAWARVGDWDAEDRSIFVTVFLEDIETGECDQITVVLDPPEPDCSAGVHDWRDDLEVVGGIESAPGIWSNNNGGVFITECCAHCGKYRKQDTRAQNHNGESGFHTTWYEDTDEVSRAWVESLETCD